VPAYYVYEGGNVVATSMGTDVTVSSLDPGTSYAFTVSGYDVGGHRSATSAAVTATTPAADTNDSDPNAGNGAGDAFADYQKEYASGTSVDGTGDVYSQPIKGNFNQLRNSASSMRTARPSASTTS
jgi:chitinase